MYNVCTVHIHSPTIHFGLEILVAFEDGVFHDLTHYVLQFTQPEVEILVPISRAFPHVEGLDVAIIGPVHSLVKIRVQVLGIEVRIT
jgi:hypothetical protein